MGSGADDSGRESAELEGVTGIESLDVLADGNGFEDDEDSLDPVEVLDKRIEELRGGGLEVQENSRDDEFMEEQIEDLESLRRDYNALLDEHIETLQELKGVYRRGKSERRGMEFWDPWIGRSRFLEFREEYLEVLEDFRDRYADLRERHEESQDEFEEMLEVHEGLEEEYSSLARRHENTIDDFAGEKKRDEIFSYLKSGLLTGIGLFGAETYSDTMNLLEFYLSAPGIYAENPEVAIVTLGFPVAGAYYLLNGFQDRQQHDTIEGRKRRLRTRQEFNRDRQP